MASKSNLGVSDREFIQAGNAIVTYAEKLESMIVAYCTSLKTVCDSAIQDQKITAQLKELSDQVDALRTPLHEIAEQAKKDCKKFVSEIDKADKFLY